MKFERGISPKSSMNIGEIADAEEIHCIDITYRAYYDKKLPRDAYPKGVSIPRRESFGWSEIWRSSDGLNLGLYDDRMYAEGSISIVKDALEEALMLLSEEKWAEFEEKIGFYCEKCEKANKKREKRGGIFRKKWGNVIKIVTKNTVVQVSAGEYSANMPISHLSGNSVQYNGKLYIIPHFPEKNP